MKYHPGNPEAGFTIRFPHAEREPLRIAASRAKVSSSTFARLAVIFAMRKPVEFGRFIKYMVEHEGFKEKG